MRTPIARKNTFLKSKNHWKTPCKIRLIWETITQVGDLYLICMPSSENNKGESWTHIVPTTYTLYTVLVRRHSNPTNNFKTRTKIERTQGNLIHKMDKPISTITCQVLRRVQRVYRSALFLGNAGSTSGSISKAPAMNSFSSTRTIFFRKCKLHFLLS